MNLRRRLLAFLAFAPVAAWAQPAPGVHRIGTLSGGSSPKAKEATLFPVFFEEMRKLGYVEDRNVVYENRYAEGTPARFPQLARELILKSAPGLAQKPVRVSVPVHSMWKYGR